MHSQDNIRTCKPHAVLAVHCNYYIYVHKYTDTLHVHAYMYIYVHGCMHVCTCTTHEVTRDRLTNNHTYVYLTSVALVSAAISTMYYTLYSTMTLLTRRSDERALTDRQAGKLSASMAKLKSYINFHRPLVSVNNSWLQALSKAHFTCSGSYAIRTHTNTYIMHGLVPTCNGYIREHNRHNEIQNTRDKYLGRDTIQS